MSIGSFIEDLGKGKVQALPTNPFGEVGGAISDTWKNLGSELYDNRGLIASGGIALAMPGATFAFVLGLTDRSAVNQVFDVVVGKYSGDQEEISKTNEEYTKKIAEYEQFASAYNMQYIINDEIFQISAKNKFRRENTEILKQVTALYEKLQAQVADFNAKYKFINDSLKSTVGEIMLYLPIIIGGIANDAADFFMEGDWEAGRSLLGTILTIVGIVIEIVAGILVAIGTLGGGAVVSFALFAAAAAQLVSLINTLDNRYAQGMLTKAMFSMLDVILNDVLQLDDYVSKDFKKLGDSEYYAELNGYLQTGLVIVSVLASLYTIFTAPNVLGDATKIAGGSTLSAVTNAVPGTGYLANAYTLYAMAKTIGDVAEMDKQYNNAKKKLEEQRAEIETRVRTLRARKMQQAYMEMEDMLTDTSEVIHQYVSSSFASPTATFDPEMTIHANFGYRFSGDSFMKFGYEEVFKTDVLAGDPEYESQVLFRTY